MLSLLGAAEHGGELRRTVAVYLPSIIQHFVALKIVADSQLQNYLKSLLHLTASAAVDPTLDKFLAKTAQRLCAPSEGCSTSVPSIS